jgi:hypothetical protein
MTRWEGFPEQPIYQGWEGLEAVLNLLHGDIGLVVNEPAEVIPIGEDRVFVEGRTKVRGTSSGIEVSLPPFGQIVDLREGLIARVDNYSDVAEARRAAGLSAA